MIALTNQRKILLVGRPNCGKTTLFNQLSGLHQKTGNWSGVTVKQQKAVARHIKTYHQLIDLPGCLTLIAVQGISQDELLTCYTLNKLDTNDIVINVVHARHLQQDLYLTHQLLERCRTPVIVVLNCMDLAYKNHLHINTSKLAKLLTVPIIPMVSTKTKGIDLLIKQINLICEKNTELNYPVRYPIMVEKLTQHESYRAVSHLPYLNSKGAIVHAFEGDELMRNACYQSDKDQIYFEKKRQIFYEQHGDFDILLASYRYDVIKSWLDTVLLSPPGMFFRPWLDKIFLNCFLGIPIFLFIMYIMFIFAINIGGAFQDFFDLSSQSLLINLPKLGLEQFKAPTWLVALLADGFGRGLNVTITFIPVLAAMFFFLAFLEQSGYMTRAAIIIDRLMQYLGLPGQSFIPMIVGFGCNVPAVISTRTLEYRQEKILTILMTPFMSCSARLAIYTVFVAAFFPLAGQNIIFALYFLGIVVAIFTGLVMRTTILGGQGSRLTLELPDYQIPRFTTLYRQTFHNLKRFLYKAGILIVPLSMLLSGLGSWKSQYSPYNMLEKVGRAMTPIFAPIGITKDNWPATLSLLTGIMAKEVIIGSLNALYFQEQTTTSVSLTWFEIRSGLQDAIKSVPKNISKLGGALSNPFRAVSNPVNYLHQGFLGVMYLKFTSPLTAFAYLLFVLLYFPCISVVAAMTKELNRSWALFSVFWCTSLAYMISVAFYQIATWRHHPLQTLIWLMVIGTFASLIWLVLRWQFRANSRKSISIPITINI